MKNMVKKSFVYLVVAMLLVAVPAAYAQGPFAGGGKGQPHGMRKMGNLAEELDLTTEQQERMKALRQENKGKRQQLQQELKESRKALKEELGKYRSDPAVIDGAVAQMKDLQAQLIDYRVDHFVEMKRILTPEQFEKMSKIKQGREKGRKDRRKKRHF